MTSDDLVHLVDLGVTRTLELASTWLAWDGLPRVSEDGTRIYTPHKVIRRYVDHLVDHLAEIEALLAGEETEPDGWYASTVTLDADWAHFTEADLNEAAQRLRRLARIYAIRLGTVGANEWSRSREPNWTLRTIVQHVSSSWYAEQLGDLRRTSV
jgi:DNA-binding transcriptional MerR regulator